MAVTMSQTNVLCPAKLSDYNTPELSNANDSKTENVFVSKSTVAQCSQAVIKSPTQYHCDYFRKQSECDTLCIHNDEWKSFQCHHQTALRFASWFSLELKSRISYHLEWDKVTEAMKDQLWLSTKETWNIPNDNAKVTQLRIANDLFRKFKNNLVTNYVNKNKLPFEDYKFLDDRDWEDFVASKRSKVFLDKSAKAKASANQNKDPARVGRSGYLGKEAQWKEEMAELVEEYPDLEGLQCDRSVKHVLGRLVRNKETGKKELTEAHRLRLKQLARKEREMIADGTIHIAGQDPLTKVLGPDHPGRTRAKSSVVGKKKGLGNAGVRKRKVVIDDYDAFVNKVTLNVLAAIPTLQQDSGTSQQPQSIICASGGSFDEFNEIEILRVRNDIAITEYGTSERTSESQLERFAIRTALAKDISSQFES
ncbi:hypothetical protein Tco_1327206 [Tanacetum coccineum]